MKQSEERAETQRRWQESTERAEKEAEVLRMLHRTSLVHQVQPMCLCSFMPYRLHLSPA